MNRQLLQTERLGKFNFKLALISEREFELRFHPDRKISEASFALFANCDQLNLPVHRHRTTAWLNWFQVIPSSSEKQEICKLSILFRPLIGRVVLTAFSELNNYTRHLATKTVSKIKSNFFNLTLYSKFLLLQIIVLRTRIGIYVCKRFSSILMIAKSSLGDDKNWLKGENSDLVKRKRRVTMASWEIKRKNWASTEYKGLVSNAVSI